MILGVLLILLVIISIFGIITFRKIQTNNKMAVGTVTYKAVRNFWLAFILGIGLIIVAATGLGYGIIDAMPYMDMMEGEGDISGYANIIAAFVNLFLSLASFAYLIAIFMGLIIGVTVYIQLILIIYCRYCIRHRMYINGFYKYVLLIVSIISLVASIIIIFEIGSIIIAL